jgi:hypothetical protein
MTEPDAEYLDEVVLNIFQLMGNPNKLKVMLGATTFIKGYFERDNHPGIQFKFPRRNGINCCQLTLDIDLDLYRLKFFNIKGINTSEVSVHSELFVESVRQVFEQETGLYLSL